MHVGERLPHHAVRGAADQRGRGATGRQVAVQLHGDAGLRARPDQPVDVGERGLGQQLGLVRIGRL
ncbi:hypothetical protein A7K94_0216545, partial [Modestobacter sp. VKM Ac-2676]